MWKKLLCCAVVGLFVFGLLAGFGKADDVKLVVQKSPAVQSLKGYTPHAPIRINSDAEFDNYASNRTIWGLEIDGTGFGDCIYIGNCSQPFIVKDCYLHNASGKSDEYFGNVGLYLYKSRDGMISNNNVSNNQYGIALGYSENNIISNNQMINDGIVLVGYLLNHWNTQSISTSNIVNQKPVYYWKNKIGGTIPSRAGQIILANCSNVKVEYQNVSDGSCSIELGFSFNCIISKNTVNSNDGGIYFYRSNSSTISNNDVNLNDGPAINLASSINNIISNNVLNSNLFGIYLNSSINNTISNNTVSSNREDGICLGYSYCNLISYNNISSNTNFGISIGSSIHNRIYQNNFINNSHGTPQACDDSNKNFWNTSTDGNYWSDWTHPDFNHDGIVDNPYNISGSSNAKDYYPLTTQVAVPAFSPAPAIILSVILLTSLVVLVRRRIGKKPPL